MDETLRCECCCEDGQGSQHGLIALSASEPFYQRFIGGRSEQRDEEGSATGCWLCWLLFLGLKGLWERWFPEMGREILRDSTFGWLGRSISLMIRRRELKLLAVG
jgi:hypothetical protein